VLTVAVKPSFWTQALPVELNAGWQAEMRQLAIAAEPRRQWADYDTGSITEEEAYALRALAEHVCARVVIEVGTFIGMSTSALASASSVKTVYTCDASNHCLKGTDIIKTFPKQTSTQMLTALVSMGVQADLCFFDGVLSREDIDLLAGVCRESTVFAVHDYNYGPKRRRTGLVKNVPKKGIGNALLLTQRWPTLTVEPLPDTVLAVLVPESRL
jgi:hypothetical protein